MDRLAIISTNKFKYSETFIHLHVRELAEEVHLLHTGYLPEFVSRGLEGEDVALISGEFRRTGWESLRRMSAAAVREKRLRAAIGAYLEANQLPVVLAEYGPAGVAMMDICQAAKIPLWVHFHGYDAGRADILAEQGRLYPEMFRKAAGMIVVSAHMRQALLRLGAAPEQVHLLPYGVDTRAFAPAEVAPSTPYLLALGRMTAKKSPQRTLEAFAVVAEEFPATRLVMAGDGQLLPDCQQLAARLGVQDRVEFRGAVAHAEVPALLRGACALVQHSVTTADGDAEGLPLAVLEAMSTGIPVVATRHAGIPDAITHGVEGWLCAEGATSEMAAHLRELLRDPVRARALGQAGRRRVLQDFSQERYLAGLRALLNASI